MSFKRSVGLSLAVLVPGGTWASSPRIPNDEATIVHALNRLGYGPRPGEVERIQKMGLEKWIEEQLRPEKIEETIRPAMSGRISTPEFVALACPTVWRYRGRKMIAPN